MAFLAAALPYIAAAGTAVTVLGQAKQASDQKAQADAQAAAEVNQANADAAASQRQAITDRRQASYQMSRAQALAASSGAGASDPTVASVIGSIGGQGEWNALTALYEGGTQEENLQSQAQATRNAGAAAQSAGYLKGISTVLSGGNQIGYRTLATKYG